MDRNELLSRVRKIEIKTRALSRNIFAGEYHSAFKGRGMSFSEVREYQVGDDVRHIDWNVTARFNRPYVEVYEEERELTVMLLVDVSSSLAFGTRSCYKNEMVTEIAATLAYSAILNNDKIGVVFFSDQIEKYIAPKKGKKHILNIIEFLMRTQRKSCTSFVISDFLDVRDYSHALDIMSRKHDAAAIQVYDKYMSELPAVGLVKVQDAEDGTERYIDTSSRRIRDAHHQHWVERQRVLVDRMNKSNMDLVSVRTDEDYVKALISLFAKRMRP